MDHISVKGRSSGSRRARGVFRISEWRIAVGRSSGAKRSPADGTDCCVSGVSVDMGNDGSVNWSGGEVWSIFWWAVASRG